MSAELAGVSGTSVVMATAAVLVGKVLGKPASELGELFADYVRGWRLLNLARTADKVEKTLQERGLPFEVKPLPTGVGLALIEATSREDAEDLQSLWANLLANHSDPSRSISIDKDIIEIVRQLTSADAVLLTFLGHQTLDINFALSGGFDCPRISDALDMEPSRVARSINSLWRLGCLLQLQAGSQMLDGGGLRRVGPTADANVSYQPSPMGEAILEAVAP
jgi:hypothetical protein